MFGLIALVQGTGLAYAAGLNLYAAVAVTGLAVRFGWAASMPSTIQMLGSVWIIGIALVLYALEFAATLIPGVAPAWETLHSLVRPPAAAILAAATAWHADPVFVLIAALLGGAVAIATHTTNLGLRYAIEGSPGPATNGAANLVELAIVCAITISVWRHPFVTFAVTTALLVCLGLTVRLIWRALRQVVSGRWMPAQGLMQPPRVMERRGGAHFDE